MEIQAKMSNKTNKNQRNSPVSLKSLLRKAIRFGTVQEVQRFRWFSDKIEYEFNLKRKADPNKEPLFVVMEKEDAKLYQEVLKFNIDLNCRVGTEDMTALHYAVYTGNILAVAMFLYYGFDPDSLTRDNQVPVKLAKSRNMRNVFSDFKQMNRAKFAKKYKLKISQPTAKPKPFPFLELPPEIQELIWSYVPLVHMWICQFVSKEWLEMFRIRTRANTDDDLFPRGQFNLYTKIGYYQTEYHFSFANGCELNKEYYGNMQYIFNNTMPGSQIKAVKKLINFEDTSGSSNDFKEKLYSYKKPGLECYYIQKSKYFGIAIEITPVDEKTRKEKALAAWFKTYADRNKQFLA